MSDVGDLLAQRASQGQPTDIQALLEQRAAQSPTPVSAAPVVAPFTKGQRFVHGLADLPTGLGQLTEHVAETPLNWFRKGIQKSLNAIGAHDAASLFDPVTSNDFDQIVSTRENDYQQARAAAGQTGIDWWRLGGAAANPLNYAIPGGPASTVLGRVSQAAIQGAAVSAAQPTDVPGEFWWQKVKNSAVGAVTGAAIAGTIEAAMPAIKWGYGLIKKAIGTKEAAASPAADVIVNDALKAKNVDPNTIDVTVLAGMKKEVQSALDNGAEPSAEAIANRATAESLPVPVHLMRGQATGDAMQFAKEQNLRGISGVGEPLTNRLTEQNQAFVQNLDALGAKDGPDTVTTGTAIASKLQSAWDKLQQTKDDLYNAVRNNKGQPAMMDQFTVAQQIKDTLDTPQASHAYDLLPSHIQKTIDDLADGNLPLTVAQMQSLDKTWGMAARGASDGSVRHAINEARNILNNAPVSDNLGEQARTAYQAARQAHAQQMSLIDKTLLNGRPNPNYQPLMDAVVNGKPGEELFTKQFMNAAPSVAKKNLAFLSTIDPDAPEVVGKTMMGEIKRLALSSASDERGTISQSVLNSWARDPIKSARMDALLPQPLVGTFRNLARTVEVAKRYPVASAVNTSNTGSAVVNAGVSMLKNSALAQISKRLPLAKMTVEGLAEANAKQGVQSALNPGVTLKSLLSTSPAQAYARRLTAQAAIPAFLANKKQNVSNENDNGG